MSVYRLRVVLVLAVAAPLAARADDAPPSTAPGRGLSLTVSGAVSLGAYEAGVLSYTIAGAGAGHGGAELRLVTGASAGSINALLSILSACGDRSPQTRSLFWRTWIPVGFDQLLVSGRVSSLGAFSRDWLARGAAQIEEAWNKGLDASCDVVMGIAATRLEPRVLLMAGGRLELPRTDEKFAVRIRGRGFGLPPRVTNYSSVGVHHASLLVTSPEGEVPFSALRDLLFASMSFPIAFPPQPLGTCSSGETARPTVCLPSEARTASFMDGGVFDNAPLRLAVQLASALRDRGGRLEWQDGGDGAGAPVPQGLAFGYLHPDMAEYPLPSTQSAAGEPSLPRQVAGLVRAFVDTARAKELSVLLEEHGEVADRVFVSRRRFPAAGAPLSAFLGFFETEFRMFDFTLGMYDARLTLLESPAAGAIAVAPELLVEGPAGFASPAWLRFRCMNAVYQGLPEAASACAAEELADFRALLQVSLDQLYDACASTGTEAPGRWQNEHCQRAARGQPPPHVPLLAPSRWPAWRRRTGESDLGHSMRLLGAYGFQFRDLGAGGSAALATRRIREGFGRAGRALAWAQPSASSKSIVDFGAKMVADSVSYLPPARVLHLTLGPTETELGLSFATPKPAWVSSEVRLAGAVGLRGLGVVFSSRGSEPFAVIAAGGVELQPRPGNSALSQVRVGLRAGWLSSTGDHHGARPCDDRGSKDITACSRSVVQGVIGWTALERIRLQAVGEWYPGSRTRQTSWSVAPGFGFELGF